VGTDVVDLIMQDHREVERLFDELKTHPEKRPLLIPTLTSLLTAHSRAEEAEVYPVARDEAGEAEEVAHSQEEHAEAEQLLARLAKTDPQSPQFDEVLTEVVEAVTHHVEEEESTVLPGMRQRLTDARRAELGKAFAASRAEHMGDKPGEASREELLLQAQNAGLTGASSMSKDELARELKKMASS
jgi:hemerythrin superfamily protein